MTGLEMRKLIHGGTCPQCGSKLQEPTKVKDIVTFGKCKECEIHWDAWETPGNTIVEATPWKKLNNPPI